MVCVNFFLWAFICNVSVFTTVETGSFCFAAVYIRVTWLVGLGIGPLLGWGLSFACIPGG